MRLGSVSHCGPIEAPTVGYICAGTELCVPESRTGRPSRTAHVASFGPRPARPRAGAWAKDTLAMLALRSPAP